MADLALVNDLTQGDFLEIEKLAEENYGPRDIAKALRVSVRSFMHVWRDKKSQVRSAYDLGRLNIDIKKSEKLIGLIDADNVTAIQIHDKKSKERAFEDARFDVFGI